MEAGVCAVYHRTRLPSNRSYTFVDKHRCQLGHYDRSALAGIYVYLQRTQLASVRTKPTLFPLLTASQVGIFSQVRNKIKDARPRGRSKKLPEAPTYPVHTHRTYSGCLTDAQRYVMCHLKRTSQQTQAQRNDQSHSRSQSSFEQRVDPID